MSDYKLNFQNTEIAFATKSDAELEKRRWLFNLMNSPLITSLGTKSAQLGLALGLPIKGLIKQTIFKQFCGGETIEECNDVIRDLGKSNIGTILDYSIEGKSSEKVFENTKAEILRTLERAKSDKNVPFAVFKISGIARFELLEKVSAKEALNEAEEQEWQRAKDRVWEICDYANTIDQPLFIDAEESWVQDAIDNLVVSMMQEYNRKKPLIYNTIQLYRHDRLAFLKEAHIDAKEKKYFLAVKLVRGAYMEKERERAAAMNYASPIQPDKESTDRDFNLAVQYCVDHLEDTAFVNGSHNESSVQLLIGIMHDRGIPSSHPHVHFSQLYGMSDNLSYVLADAGFNVSKYVPYGPVKDTLPYLIRRAKENTAVMGQMSRELELIEKEIRRRKAARKTAVGTRKQIEENENVLSEIRKR